jgi:release factor H-coupled RctB family protein
LLNVAVVRPVFIWGPSGIGKSALVERFADEVGLPCVSLLGSQLEPEDLIGVPQIVDGCSRFCPPVSIARTTPYCLFLDELNACSHEVQKAFYSLIHERRIGEYCLPDGSVVVGAGNRAQDSAIVKPMSSALINRMIHVHLKVSHRDWLEWAGANNIHPLVVQYIQNRPEHLWVQPPKHEEAFSSPRSWHMLSDALHEYGDALNDQILEVLAFGCVSAEHAGQFKAFAKPIRTMMNECQSEQAEVRVLASANNWIEGIAEQQLRKTAGRAGMRLAVGLPDLHPGKGSPIGAAFAVEGRLYPALVGSDIGCGIGLWQTSLRASKIRREAWADKLRRLDEPWDGDVAAWLAERGVAPSGFEPSLGTIGGGNHFAELQVIERVEDAEAFDRLGLTTEQVYLLVHSGSRGYGEAILRQHVEYFRFEGLRAGSPDAQEYLARHENARHWAEASRALIAARVVDRLGADGQPWFDICHNWIEQREVGGRVCWLHRKGAAPSTCGPLVIPGSRGAFSYLVLPVDAGERSCYSLAHGAGRKWARTDSRARLEKRFAAKDLTRTELGSYVICEDKDLLFEEAPQAYKNITVVVEDLVREGLVQIVALLRPVVTYKVRR